MRRNGYKLILAKDTYIYHFGDNALKSYTAEKQNFYQVGRQRFYDTFGIDPWGEGLCYDPKLLSILSFSGTEATNILEINCGMGNGPLKIKEVLKENCHNKNVKVYNITNNINFSDDLKGVSDCFQYVKDLETMNALYKDTRFDYIMIEGSIEIQNSPVRIINKAYELLSAVGVLIIKVVQPDFKKKLKGLFPQIKIQDDWIVVQHP